MLDIGLAILDGGLAPCAGQQSTLDNQKSDLGAGGGDFRSGLRFELLAASYIQMSSSNIILHHDMLPQSRQQT
jgi:hypothetical protein